MNKKSDKKKKRKKSKTRPHPPIKEEINEASATTNSTTDVIETQSNLIEIKRNNTEKKRYAPLESKVYQNK